MSPPVLQPIDDFIFRGFEERFQQVFGCTQCAFINQNDKTQILSRLFDGDEITYPYAWFEIETTTNSVETYSANYFVRRGLDIGVHGDKIYRARLAPTTFSISINYVTLQFDGVMPGSVRSFIRRWSMGRRAGYMKFKVNYGRVQFGIRVDLDDSLSIPKRENVTETEPVYTITAGAQIHGYVSDPVISEIGKISHFDVQTSIEGAAANVAGSQFFPFNK